MYAYCDKNRPSKTSDPGDVTGLCTDGVSFYDFHFPGARKHENNKVLYIFTMVLTIYGWIVLLSLLMLAHRIANMPVFSYPGTFFHLWHVLSFGANMYAFWYGYSTVLMPSSADQDGDNLGNLLDCIHANLNTSTISAWNWTSFRYWREASGPLWYEELKSNITLYVANPQLTTRELDLEDERLRFALFVANPRNSGGLYLTYSRQHSLWVLSMIQLSLYCFIKYLFFIWIDEDSPPKLCWLFFKSICFPSWLWLQNVAVYCFKEIGGRWQKGRFGRDIRKELLAVPRVHDLEKA